MTLLGGPAGGGGGGESSGQGYPQPSAPRGNQSPRSSDPIPPSLAAGSDDDDLPF
jgi:single-strand DNA-binding protein